MGGSALFVYGETGLCPYQRRANIVSAMVSTVQNEQQIGMCGCGWK
jgi:hypothetical protein